MTRPLDDEEITRQLAELPGWTGDRNALRRTYEFPDFVSAIAAVDEVAVAAEDRDHHPDIDIRWRAVTFALSTHTAGGVTQLDIELAYDIVGIAMAHGGH